MLSDLLSIPEAATMLHLRPSTVRAWIQQKRIAHVKLGARVFLQRADLEALIAQSIVPAKEKAQAIV